MHAAAVELQLALELAFGLRAGGPYGQLAQRERADRNAVREREAPFLALREIRRGSALELDAADAARVQEILHALGIELPALADRHGPARIEQRRDRVLALVREQLADDLLDALGGALAADADLHGAVRAPRELVAGA